MSELARARSWRTLPAWTITAALAVPYLIFAPYSADLAAASYRSDLFAKSGFTLWDNSWYGGHHLPAYSLLAPALGSLVGPRLVAALSMVAVAALFAKLIDGGHFPARATRVASVWLALGAAIGLLSSRVPFDLGLAIALASLVLAQRGLWPAALALAVLASVASPVAGAFLALAALAWALAGPARPWPGGLTVAALTPILVLTVVFPEGGSQPFVASAYYPALAGVIAVGCLIPSEQRTLRIGVLLYALTLTGAYLVASAVGGNSDRLAALFAGPLAACLLVSERPPELRSWRGRTLVVLVPLFLYWQANAPVTDFASAASDPAVHASYYSPLLDELDVLDVGYSGRPARIEVVPTADHWEARWVAPHVPIARGWERQLDKLRNGVFYETTPLSATRYRAWIEQTAVSYIALPDAPLDYSARGEAALLRTGAVSGLREVWRSSHWRLFAVRNPTPLVQLPATLTSLASDSLTLHAPRPGTYTVRVRFTPYWALAGGDGCVAQAPDEWTQIHARRAGAFHLVIRFSFARIFDRGPRCT